MYIYCRLVVIIIYIYYTFVNHLCIILEYNLYLNCVLSIGSIRGLTRESPLWSRRHKKVWASYKAQTKIHIPAA